MKELYEQLGISSQVYDFCHEIEESLKERFEQFDKTAEYNQMKVIRAMQENRVSEGCFNYVSGYGIMILEGIHWSRFMRRYFIPRQPGTSTDYLWNACTGTGTGCQSASGR